MLCSSFPTFIIVLSDSFNVTLISLEAPLASAFWIIMGASITVGASKTAALGASTTAAAITTGGASCSAFIFCSTGATTTGCTTGAITAGGAEGAPPVADAHCPQSWLHELQVSPDSQPLLP